MLQATRSLPLSSNSDLQNNVVLEVRNPTEEATENYHGRFVIAAERISPGQIGLVWATGIVPAWIMAPDDEAEFADISFGHMLEIFCKKRAAHTRQTFLYLITLHITFLWQNHSVHGYSFKARILEQCDNL